ncbi:hypothetical protein DUNSADRAFT_17372 [Dunaliella salina]|uniref:SF4 helicase domain-containing protein n=1 Tax=Dunaliella salina TaxID=3046 RepID=A0ABQ7H094_DUNSA|nr:hypothetical protein DUNSADRAFT_17372 [Dunaliella salina]|eukprot:KAF5840269.1 hypothetical protein DUNSADRAFT_17372 [Dunaliella salina]
MQLSFSPLMSAIRGEAWQPHIAGLRAALEGSRMQDLLYRRVTPVHMSSNCRKGHSSRLYSSAGGNPEQAQPPQHTKNNKRDLKARLKEGSNREAAAASTNDPRAANTASVGSAPWELQTLPAMEAARGRRQGQSTEHPQRRGQSKGNSKARSSWTADASTSTSSRSRGRSPSIPNQGASSTAHWEGGQSQYGSPKSTSPSPAQPQGTPPDFAQPQGRTYGGRGAGKQRLRLGSPKASRPDPVLVKGIQSMKDEQRPVRPNVHFTELNEEMIEFFKKRKIEPATLQKFGVKMAPNIYSVQGESAHAIAFPYKRNGEVVNVKYRTLSKKFWQEKNAEKILFGYDQVVEAHGGSRPEELIIVEGEMDVLALYEAGYKNVVSVPDGAPAVARASTPLSSTKFSYLGASWSLLEGVQKFVIATDNDNPGNALAEELMRRLNRELCWRVRWSKAGPPPSAPAPAAAAAPGPPQEEADTLSPVQAEQPQEVQQGGEDRSGSEGVVNEQLEGGQTEGSPSQLEADSSYRKDGNDVLVRDGPEAVRQRVGDAEPSPIVGLYRFESFLDDIMAQYREEDDQGVAYPTGWRSLDPIYKVVLGEVSIVSGVPNSGKSEWIDALLMNLSWHHGWAFALCSLEKTPDKHAIQLIEKYKKKPFYDRWDYDYYNERDGQQLVGGKVNRMSEGDVVDGLKWINDRFQIISNIGNDFPTIDWILDKARSAVLRYGIHGLVIDPYNEINHARPRDMNETEYVSVMMSKVKRFAQTYDVAVWFVAHPRQQQAWTGGAPDMYCISGSANFVNKADNVIMVHRPYQPKAGFGQDSKGSKQQDLLPNEVQIYMCKVRNKLAGTRSQEPARLAYDRVSGLYYDNEQEFMQKISEREDEGQYSCFKDSDGYLIPRKDLHPSPGSDGQFEDVQAGDLWSEDYDEGEEEEISGYANEQGVHQEHGSLDMWDTAVV